MKLSNQTKYETLGINTATLTGISLLWGQMLGLLNIWFTPLTIFVILLGFGSEVRYKDKDATNTTTKLSI